MMPAFSKNLPVFKFAVSASLETNMEGVRTITMCAPVSEAAVVNSSTGIRCRRDRTGQQLYQLTSANLIVIER